MKKMLNHVLRTQFQCPASPHQCGSFFPWLTTVQHFPFGLRQYPIYSWQKMFTLAVPFAFRRSSWLSPCHSSLTSTGASPNSTTITPKHHLN